MEDQKVCPNMKDGINYITINLKQMKLIDFTIKDFLRKDGINITNLAKLGDYVQAHVTDNMFTMGHFLEYLHGESRLAHGCDTIGCLLGYSPVALGVEISNKHQYALTRYSIYSGIHYNISASDEVYKFLFDVHWENIDNSRLGALLRIKFVIDHDDYDYGETDYDRWYELIRQRMPLFN